MEELKMDELSVVTGGRGMNAEEKASQWDIERQYYDLKDYYYSKKMSKFWPAVEEEIHEAAAK